MSHPSSHHRYNLIQNSQAVKKSAALKKAMVKKARWRPRNGCDGRLMVKNLMTIQVNFGAAWS